MNLINLLFGLFITLCSVIVFSAIGLIDVTVQFLSSANIQNLISDTNSVLSSLIELKQNITWLIN